MQQTAAIDVLKHATGTHITFMCIHLHTPLNPVHMIFQLASFVLISTRLCYESKIYLFNLSFLRIMNIRIHGYCVFDIFLLQLSTVVPQSYMF